jgi:hypothetical protein
LSFLLIPKTQNNEPQSRWICARFCSFAKEQQELALACGGRSGSGGGGCCRCMIMVYRNTPHLRR